MTRHIRPGHVAFYQTNTDPARPSAIRRAQKNAGSHHVCIYCGEPQINVDAVKIHQRLCEYCDDTKRAELNVRREKQRRRERIFDNLYDLGYLIKA